jgi:hypothetical protein
MGQNLKTGGKKDSVTPSTRLLNQKLGTSPAPRRLQPSEIALLRQSKQEIARELGAAKR